MTRRVECTTVHGMLPAQMTLRWVMPVTTPLLRHLSLNQMMLIFSDHLESFSLRWPLTFWIPLRKILSFEKNLLLKEIAEVYSKFFDGDLANAFKKVKQFKTMVCALTEIYAESFYCHHFVFSVLTRVNEKSNKRYIFQRNPGCL